MDKLDLIFFISDLISADTMQGNIIDIEFHYQGQAFHFCSFKFGLNGP